jgi:hypothetical protein
MRHTFIAALLALAACATEPQLSPNIPPLILSGDITRADHQTYRELPFTVPPGTRQITIDFAYTNKENRTVIDLGLRDPQDQRGWSGGNKSHIEIGEFNATPSYRPGKIQPGEWKLVLGVPNTREGQTARYEATVTFSGERGSPNDEGVIAPATFPATKPGWFRGDFHMHTAHSDGSCDVDGARAPCPAIRTFEAARDGGLDFAAITDHNTITQLADIRLEQGRFPKTLFIPGMEITTFFGHANAIGVTDFVDFQLGSPRLPTLGKLFDELDAQGAILSANHPGLPSGEICMGCGWTVKDTDWSRVAAIEVVNGSTLRTGGAEGPTSGIRFWDNLLKQGYRLTAIGGSDNHDATDRTGARQSPIGTPTTVVYASELSTKAIIAGVRSGRAFVDVAGLPGATLEIKALAGKQDVEMGGEVRLAEDESAFIDIISANIPADARLTLVSANLVATQPTRVPAPRNDLLHRMDSFSVKLAEGAVSGYIRPEIRDASGKLLLLGNPIYVRRK